MAARMESSSEENRILCSEASAAHLKEVGRGVLLTFDRMQSAGASVIELESSTESPCFLTGTVDPRRVSGCSEHQGQRAPDNLLGRGTNS